MWAHGAFRDSAAGKFLCQETPACAKHLPQQTMIWTASRMPVGLAGLGSRIHIHIRIHIRNMYIISDPISSQKRGKTWLNDSDHKNEKEEQT